MSRAFNLHSTPPPIAIASPTMAETQRAAPYTPPPYLHADYQHRRLPQPIHLPPLSIPAEADQPQHPPGPYQHPLQPIHVAAVPQIPLSRPQPRIYAGPAAPLDKLLSPHPFTPPRSEPAYSPQRSPPRSAIDPYPQQRPGNEHYPPEYTPRSSRSDQVHPSSADPHRHAFSSWPSPTANHVPYYGPGHSHVGYRQAMPAPPPPLSAGPVVQYHPHPQQAQKPVYSEPAPPPQRSVAAPVSRMPPAEKSPLKHILKVRQQPIAARACGFGERDRRVIDPPPIIQLEVRDSNDELVDLDELRYSLNVVHCTLWNAEGTHEETALIQQDRRTTRRLMGQLVASPSVAKDEHDVEGCFFCFPDLSCRTHGKYRLRFVLMRIDPMNMHVGGFSPILTEVLSEVFTVYTAKDFPGMRPSSALTRALKLQGCNIQVKKGNERALARKRQSISSDEGGEDKEGKGKRRRQN